MKKLFKLAFVLFVALSTIGCTPDEKRPETGKYATSAIATPREWDGEKRAEIAYQLLVYSFADSNGDGVGDFDGITAKLDYLDALGATALWLSPIHPAMSYHGYDVLDYAAVNPDYGTMEDFEELVVAAHAKGIKIYLDYVLNHTGRDHEWFKSAAASATSPYRNYYILTETPEADIAAGRIPMIATEGAAGYDSGQWFTTPGTEEFSGRYLFTLDWSNSTNPTITVTTTSNVDSDNPDTSTSGAKYLYFGDAKCKKFYAKGNNKYTLAVDFASSWGFLIRTSSTDWSAGTKYGAENAQNQTVSYGVPFRLHSNASGDPKDVKLPGMSTLMFHSHFWTDWFADLNYGSAATCEQSEPFKAVVKIAEGWIDRGVDGFRLDAVKHIYHNASSDENPTFLHKFYTTLNTYFRRTHDDDLYMVGEVFSGADEVAPYYAGLPALFEFDFWNRLQWAINNGTGCYLTKDLLSYRAKYATYRSDYIEATKLSNHDEVRAAESLERSADKCKLAACVLLTAAGEPYIYYGEELGYYGSKNGGDEYVRQPMRWGDATVTSYTSKIDGSFSVADVKSQESDGKSLLNVYRTFARLRQTYPALAYGTVERHGTFNEDNAENYKAIGAWYRTADDERLLVVHNFGATMQNLTVTDKVTNTAAVNGTVLMLTNSSGTRLQMAPYSSIVLEVE